MSASYDVLIRAATVYDGLGSPPQQADVALEGGRIAAIGSLDGASAKAELDATGRALCPGFIDVHTHDDFAALMHPDMAFKSRGGVTTCIVGNCGFGAAPFAAAREMLGQLTPRKSDNSGSEALKHGPCRELLPDIRYIDERFFDVVHNCPCK